MIVFIAMLESRDQPPPTPTPPETVARIDLFVSYIDTKKTGLPGHDIVRSFSHLLPTVDVGIVRRDKALGHPFLLAEIKDIINGLDAKAAELWAHKTEDWGANIKNGETIGYGTSYYFRKITVQQANQ